MGRNIVETIVGALVLVVAGVFVFYAFAKSDRSGPDGAQFLYRLDDQEAVYSLAKRVNWRQKQPQERDLAPAARPC